MKPAVAAADGTASAAVSGKYEKGAVSSYIA